MVKRMIMLQKMRWRMMMLRKMRWRLMMLRMMRSRKTDPKTGICARLRSRNACQNFRRATSHGNLQEKCRSPDWGQTADIHFARACAVEMHFNISEEPLYTEIYRKNADNGATTFQTDKHRPATYDIVQWLLLLIIYILIQEIARITLATLGQKIEPCKVWIPDITFATTTACISHDVARLYSSCCFVETAKSKQWRCQNGHLFNVEICLACVINYSWVL